jgi:hypothetical protein
MIVALARPSAGGASSSSALGTASVPVLDARDPIGVCGAEIGTTVDRLDRTSSVGGRAGDRWPRALGDGRRHAAARFRKGAAVDARVSSRRRGFRSASVSRPRQCSAAPARTSTPARSRRDERVPIGTCWARDYSHTSPWRVRFLEPGPDWQETRQFKVNQAPDYARRDVRRFQHDRTKVLWIRASL